MEKQLQNRIKELLTELMITNRRFAIILVSSPTAISKYLATIIENLIKIARCLTCDMNNLIPFDNVVAVKPTNN